jgi:hypothetical protein
MSTLAPGCQVCLCIRPTTYSQSFSGLWLGPLLLNVSHRVTVTLHPPYKRRPALLPLLASGAEPVLMA